MRTTFLAVLIGLAALAGCGDDETPLADRAHFTAALNDFLAQRGHVCLARYDWPVTVAAGTRGADAQQMQVLEKLGLVAGRDMPAARPDGGGAPARVYVLTDEGRKHYLHVPIVVRTATESVTHPSDLCAATLSLDQLVGWDPPQTRDGRTATSLLFTYRIAPEPWVRAPGVLDAFPMLARAIQNEGVMQLRVGVHLARQGWVADELDEPPSH